MERELKTKAGPLPLEGALEVGLVRIDEIRKSVGSGSVMRGNLRNGGNGRYVASTSRCVHLVN